MRSCCPLMVILQVANQLLYVCHDIFLSFDGNPPSDISKAFDKVRHEGLMFKMKCSGIQCELLNLLSDILDNHYQNTLNGKTSKWEDIAAGVPQGSVLAPLVSRILTIPDCTGNNRSFAWYLNRQNL